jgi:hypothetical protein
VFQNNLSEIFSYAVKQDFCIQTIGGMSENCIMQETMRQLPIQIKITLISLIVIYIVVIAASSYFLNYAYRTFIEMNFQSEIRIMQDFALNLMDNDKRLKMKIWIHERLDMLLIGGLLLCIIYLA